MTRDPGSVWAPLPEAGAPDGLAKNQFIVHSTGTTASAAANQRYFARGEIVVESTFIIGRTPDDPTLQIMDSTDRADANGSANGRAISVEVVGLGTDPFTEHQIAELIRLGRWAADVHGIARRVIPSEAGSGFGWHVMFGAPGPWTSARGKVCPGGLRIQQLKERVFPAIFSKDDDMDLKELIDFRIDGRNLWDSLRQLHADLAPIERTVNGQVVRVPLRQELADIRSAQLAAPATGGVAIDYDVLADRLLAKLLGKLAT